MKKFNFDDFDNEMGFGKEVSRKKMLKTKKSASPDDMRKIKGTNRKKNKMKFKNPQLDFNDETWYED